jgi:hypothetical protein
MTPSSGRQKGPCVCGWKMDMWAVMASHGEVYEGMQKKVKQSKISSFFSVCTLFDHCGTFQPGTLMSFW